MRPTELPFLSDQQHALRRVLSDVFADVLPTTALPRWPAAFNRLWRALAEIGTFGLLVPEEDEGAGLGPEELVLLARELGRAAGPTSVFETILAADVVSRVGEVGQREAWKDDLVAGTVRAGLAVTGSPFPSDSRGLGAILVQRGSDLYIAPANRCGLVPQPSTDGNRDLASVQYTPEPSDWLTGDPAVLKRLADLGALSAAGVLVGVSHRMLDDAASYACERRQFDRPIGTFQAVQHRLARTAVGVESASIAVHRAAHDLVRGDDRDGVVVARAHAGEVARRTSIDALQVFGGVGFTEDHHIHHWVKRAKVLHTWFGTLEHNRERAFVAASARCDELAGSVR